LRRVAITGAAAGIGRALAFELGRVGYDVLGVDVDANALERTEADLHAAGIPALFRRADLAEPDGVRAAASAMVERAPLDVVVLNAGINATGPFARGNAEVDRRVVAVNLTAPLELCARLAEHDAVARGGTIVLMSSLSRFVGYPGAAVYAATKDAVASYGRSLRVALAPRGVRVLTVFPGPTRTAHAREHSPPGSSEERRMPPEELARRIARAIEKRRAVLVPGAANRAFARLGRAAPRVTERAMKRALYDKLG